eukprot:SAG22_NODE_3055_length_1981_cov_1.324655_3_plen_149_part_00
MLYLDTLDLGMSSEKEDLLMSVIMPAPPLDCRVGVECGFVLTTRTSAGLQLPRGGLSVAVADAASHVTPCTDLMDGSYACVFEPVSVSVAGEFAFVVSADGQDFEPIRTLIDPTTGVESTVPTCKCDSFLFRCFVRCGAQRVRSDLSC